MLKKALTEFGDLSGIVFNRRSKQLVGGHQRVEAFKSSAGKVTIERSLSEPTAAGTVAEGFVFIEGERFSYREVDWDNERELAANIAANKGAGEWDYTLLQEHLTHLDHHNFDLALTMHDSSEIERLLGGWDSDISKVDDVEENTDGIKGQIKITCEPDDRDAILIYLKEKLMETSFSGVHIA